MPIIIDEMDKAISHLYHQYQRYFSHDTLKRECFDNDPAVDVEAIIIQFRQQGFLHGGLMESDTEFKLSVRGRLFWQSTPINFAGRPFAHREDRKRIKNLRKDSERALAGDVSSSVISTNEISTQTSQSTILISIISACFLLITIIQQSCNHTDKELKLLNEEQRQVRNTLQGIRESIESVNLQLKNQQGRDTIKKSPVARANIRNTP